jgi:hypothetical protein
MSPETSVLFPLPVRRYEQVLAEKGVRGRQKVCQDGLKILKPAARRRDSGNYAR